MAKENEWKPSKWTPPADLEEAFQEGRSTRKLPDGSTASLSWTPEMNDRWWSYDGALGDGQYLTSVKDQEYGLQLLPYSPSGGNGIMFVNGPRIEYQLSLATIMDPDGQPWSYEALGTDILEYPENLSTKISYEFSFPSILVSHDGRIVLNEYYTDSWMNRNSVGEAVESDEYRNHYIDDFLYLLHWYLRYSPMSSLKQPYIPGIVTDLGLSMEEQLEFNTELKIRTMWKRIDDERVELVKKPKCYRFRKIKEWLRSLPTWASMIICARLAAAGHMSLLDNYVINDNWSKGIINNLIGDAYCEASVANRVFNLSKMSEASIVDTDMTVHSFDQLALEYGPCWLMHSLIALDRSPSDSPTALDLAMDGDHWRISIDRGRVLEACRLAGAMNAPIELWPRFYSILDDRNPSRLDETAVLMLLATPVKNWPALEKAESMASGHGALVRETCCLVTAAMSKINDFCKMEDVQRAIVRSLSPDRPIAGQIVDLMMALNDVIGGVYPTNRDLKTALDDIPGLLTDKPETDETINGDSLIARDLSRMNVNEN